MINENLIKLMGKLNNNSEYLKKMKDIKNSRELYDYCSNIMGGYSKEEFDNFMQNLISANHELKALSDDKLASVSGGTVAQWLKSKMPTMPTMPTNKHELRLKASRTATDEDGNTIQVPGTWTSSIGTAAGRMSQLSMFMKLGEMIYFDDLENMGPEDFASFINEFMGSGLGLN